MEEHGIPEFIRSSERFGIDLGLERMIRLDSLLGDPQADLKAVHVAGTNGKGSTVAFISSILAAAGYKVGVYTSPYLERFSERIRIIDGRAGLDMLSEDESYGEIDEESLRTLSDRVAEACAVMTSEGYEHPTEFEIVTAVAYLYFSKENVDIAVLETGLGGRLDSTNVIEKPLVSVITSIGIDHADRLGSTISEIAYEKAGIIKPGVPVIVSEPSEMLLDGESAEAVRTVMLRRAEMTGSPLEFIRTGKILERYTENGRMTFSFDGEMAVYDTGLCGTHQIRNAALAIACCRKIEHVTGDDAMYGIRNTVWKGRAELLSVDPVVIIDGGHNTQCTESLVRTLDQILGGRLRGVPFRAVIAVMKDKDSEGMLRVLRDGGINITGFTATRALNPRSEDPSELCLKIKNVYNDKVNVKLCDDAVEAVREACGSTLADKMPLLVTGSLYLLGQVRGELKDMIAKGSF